MTRSREQRERAERKARDRAAWRARRRRLAWAGGERCATCAYRLGTLASGNDEDPGLTRVRLALLDAAEPFYCHEGPGGRELSADVPDAERRLCIGHADALTARYRAGYYDKHSPDAPEVVEALRAALAERERIYRERMLALASHMETPAR
jgi:hypothetical protein